MDRDSAVSRRDLLRGAAGVTAVTGTSGVVAAQEGQTHVVDMTDELVFAPDSITIAPSDTVVWENVGTIGHTVTAYEDDIPEEATFFATGGFDTEGDARSAYSVGDPESGDVLGGESFEHTFEVTGTYEYFCIPHESVGMLGTVEVVPGGGADGSDGEGGPTGPVLPPTAMTLLVASVTVMLSVLAFAYFFIKYGGDYGLTEDEGTRR
jgi:plastocyanin